MPSRRSPAIRSKNKIIFRILASFLEVMCIFRLFLKKDEKPAENSTDSVVPTPDDIDELESFDDIFDDD